MKIVAGATFVALGAWEQQFPRWTLNYKEDKQRRTRATQSVSLRASVCFQLHKGHSLTYLKGLLRTFTL